MTKKELNGCSHGQLTRNLGPCIRICQFNIEGISRAKCDVLQKVLSDNDVDVLAIQETHTENEEQLRKRGRIYGYDLVAATYHHAYGVATYVRSNIENVHLISTSSNNNIHEVVIHIGGYTINNTYKPPTASWPPQVLPILQHPSVYVGDFNSHHTQWKYKENDDNGEALVNWADENNMYLVFDAKDRDSFHSARWRRGYNPDLCFVTKDKDNIPLRTSRNILPDFPHSQHRPALIEIGITIPLITSFARPRWNFQKANWELFSNNLDKCLGWIPPRANNYIRFVGAAVSSAKKAIPRGYRKQYIPGWNEDCENQYQAFLDSNDQEIADELLHNLDVARRERWMETVQALDFKTSSRKAWSLLRKLNDGNKRAHKETPIPPNQIASHIVSTSKAPRDRAHTTQIKHELTALKSTCNHQTEFSRPFSSDEITTALKDVKSGKAPGFDGVHPEFLLNCGKYARRWLAKFFTDILTRGIIPQQMKRSKIIALLKPGKPSNEPKSYRPVALLSSVYKLLERLIFNRISAKILEVVPIEQAGFRPARSCADQVMSLTTYIEAGYERKSKTSAVFIDLSAAYDTVWRHGLLHKLIQTIPCLRTTRLIDTMLADRTFQVVSGEQTSAQRTLNNGLPQGSVLAPLLFNLYIADMPYTTSRKFGYADDWVLATQHKNFEVMETTLTSDLVTLSSYFRKWRLQPNPTKTETTCFHLCNKSANRQLDVRFEGNRLRHNAYPKYLGVTLDRTLTYKRHLENTAAKLKTRNNILHKLCGTTWGSSADTLHTSALGLVYSAAEYCAPAWMNSAHAKKIDVQLNNTMRIVSGTIKSTPTHWLPILSHIPPADLRRKNGLLREYRKAINNLQLPIHRDIPDLEKKRLRSRHPAMVTAKELHNANFNMIETWKEQWQEVCPEHCQALPCITERPPGYELPRKIWSSLNRIRTNHGRSADSLHKWGKVPSARCDCGADKQNIRHIVEECEIRAYGGNFSDFLTATDAVKDYICNLDVCL